MLNLCCYNEIRWPLDCDSDGSSVRTPHGLASHRMDDGTCIDTVIRFCSLYVESLPMFMLKSQYHFQPMVLAAMPIRNASSVSYPGWSTCGKARFEYTVMTVIIEQIVFRANFRAIKFRSWIRLPRFTGSHSDKRPTIRATELKSCLDPSNNQNGNQGIIWSHCSNIIVIKRGRPDIQLLKTSNIFKIGCLTAENEQYSENLNPRNRFLNKSCVFAVT